MCLLLSAWRDERGATAIEYGLMLVLISIALIAALQSLGIKIGDTLSTIDSGL